MLAHDNATLTSVNNLRVAIVEDNATARVNLRNQLMAVDNFTIHSFSSGVELRNGVRLQDYDLIFMDYHLEHGKTGVEWIQTLAERGYLNPKVGLFFITSDSQAQTIGQMLDVYPNEIIVKPYTLKGLKTSIRQYLKFRKIAFPILDSMAKQKHEQALKSIEQKLASAEHKKFYYQFLQVKGRLLLETKQFDLAEELYMGVLDKSSSVLWARWGLIKCEFMAGEWKQCQNQLHKLMNNAIARHKALEWLAGMSVKERKYNSAEMFLTSIGDSSLSVLGTRLKVFALTKQSKHIQAEELLEKKLQSNISINERMQDFAFELARYYLSRAEEAEQPHNKSDKSSPEAIDYTQKARFLLNKASRARMDIPTETHKDFMLAHSYCIDDNPTRAQKQISNVSVDAICRTKPACMLDAANVLLQLGKKDEANQVLSAIDDKALNAQMDAESILFSEDVKQLEKKHNLHQQRAMNNNERGMQLYQQGNIQSAMQNFYNAYSLLPSIPAFALNLLQCFADLSKSQYNEISADKICKRLSKLDLSANNQKKFDSLKAQLSD